jgi:hypothetical protein
LTVLESIFDRVRESRREFVAYDDGRADDDLETLFGSHGVRVERRPLPSAGVDPFLVVRNDDGEFAGAIAIEALEGLLQPPVPSLEETDGVSEGYRVLLALFQETVFSTMNSSELLAVSREIEDRAARADGGTLRACFQRYSAFAGQTEEYRWLGARPGLDVHVYGVPDESLPALPGVQYHPDVDRVLEGYWALAFVGDGPRAETTALVARQDGDAYDGFWTDDPQVTREVASLLAST